MSEYICRFCGRSYSSIRMSGEGEKDPCYAYSHSDDDFMELYCHHFKFNCYIHKLIYHEENIDSKEKLFNLITEHLIHANTCAINKESRLWYFYYSDSDNENYAAYPNYINLRNQFKNYPLQAIEVAHRSLANYALKFSHYGDIISPSWMDRRLGFEHEVNNNHSCGVMKLLEDFGYVKDPEGRECYTITALGWQKVDDMRKEEQILKQGFIAMSFKEETRSIREAFRIAMTEEGYTVAIIDEKEHNNQIVPEIFYEINRSKFVVVDVTYPNFGAYYEAGYAQALGKQVIICCRKKEFEDKENYNRPHFDISQKSMVVWDNEEDLIFRLKKRIVSTVK